MNCDECYEEETGSCAPFDFLLSTQLPLFQLVADLNLNKTYVPQLKRSTMRAVKYCWILQFYGECEALIGIVGKYDELHFSAKHI